MNGFLSKIDSLETIIDDIKPDFICINEINVVLSTVICTEIYPFSNVIIITMHIDECDAETFLHPE